MNVMYIYIKGGRRHNDPLTHHSDTFIEVGLHMISLVGYYIMAWTNIFSLFFLNNREYIYI